MRQCYLLPNHLSHLRVNLNKVCLLIIATILIYPVYTNFSAEASSNSNLYVSAENPSFDNHFAGSMIVEVIVNDSDLKEIDDAIGEPDVTLNGKNLRMVQATDGSWYAYFANINQAKIADQIVLDAGVGAEGESLDFGVFCSENTSDSVLGTSFSDTEGVAIPQEGALVSFTNGAASFNDCTGSVTSTGILNNVVRNAKTINTNPSVPPGQIGLDADAWPIIQLFSFDNVEIKYTKPGNPQQVNLEYDEIPNISFELDRSTYPSGAEVFVTIKDIQLNQDPTDEDSWTFNVNSSSASFYQAYTESGSDAGNGGAGLVNLNSKLASLDFEDNGQVTIDLTTILELKTNNKQPDSFVSDGTNTFSQIVTFVETQPNSGIFLNYDAGKESTIGVLSNAPRGLTGSFQYNDQTKSILSGTFTAAVSLSIQSTTLQPGTKAYVTLSDPDQNINSGQKEDLDVFRTSAIIPAMEIGDPLTLREASDVEFYELASTLLTAGTSIDSSVPDETSARLIIDTTTAANSDFTKISIDTGYSANSLQTLLVDITQPNTVGTNWINYDLRSIQNQLGVSDFSDTNISLFFGSLADPTPVEILASGDISSAQGFIQIDDADVLLIQPKSGTVFFVINFDASDNSSPVGSISNEIDSQPIVIDFFSFGQIDLEEINNSIYRFELEETANNSGVFTGTFEYAFTNQVTVGDVNFISSIRTIDEDVKFLISNRLISEEGIAISYSDLDQTGVAISQSTKSDILTHSGTVSTGSPSYRFGQTVVIILNDPDLNLDGDTIESYQVENNPASPIVDTVGNNGEILLEIKIKDFRYQRCTISGVLQGGLGATGFVLVETGPGTGIFEGTFKMPSQICNESGTKLISPAGGSVEAKYHDFRDSSGNPNIFGLSNLDLKGGAPPTLNSNKFIIPKSQKTIDVILSGKVGNYIQGTTVDVKFVGPDLSSEDIKVSATSSGQYKVIFTLHDYTPSGNYQVSVSYRGSHQGDESFQLSKHLVPDWIKNNARWWSEEQITDSEFINGIEHLINENIIIILDTQKLESSGQNIPFWIKNTAEWWSLDLVSDDEFVAALEFLINNGIIRI